MKVNVVVTMAGTGLRFRQAGYTKPKYEITAHGRSLFDWSMLSLENFLSSQSRAIFVCLAENNSAGYVHARSRELGLNDIHVIELEHLTDGQATSAYLSKHLWWQSEPLLIYNVDTFVMPRALKPSDIRPGSDGWIPCFQAPGEHWSFVKLGSDGWAQDVAEKERISEYASIGLYWFSRASDFVEAYDAFSESGGEFSHGERYIAPLYKHLILNKKKVSISDLPVRDVNVLGTPDELGTFTRRSSPQL